MQNLVYKSKGKKMYIRPKQMNEKRKQSVRATDDEIKINHLTIIQPAWNMCPLTNWNTNKKLSLDTNKTTN